MWVHYTILVWWVFFFLNRLVFDFSPKKKNIYIIIKQLFKCLINQLPHAQIKKAKGPALGPIMGLITRPVIGDGLQGTSLLDSSPVLGIVGRSEICIGASPNQQKGPNWITDLGTNHEGRTTWTRRAYKGFLHSVTQIVHARACMHASYTKAVWVQNSKGGNSLVKTLTDDKTCFGVDPRGYV